MDISKVSAATNAYAYQSQTKDKATQKATEEKEDVAAVYEKSSSTEDSYTVKNADLIKQLKADMENRTEQLTSLVQSMISKQGNSYGAANDIWKFLASGDYTVSADVKAQAQKDTAEDGYWGAQKTSDRILDFAKALSGGDASKAEELKAAFEKGFKEATKTWGGSLPSLCNDTYDQVIKKFDAWASGEE